MEDRIQVNGVWYVKDVSEQKLDAIEYFGVVAENERYCFDANKLLKDNGVESWDGVSIEVTDKERDITSTWDASAWFLRILDNEPMALALLKDSSDPDSIGLEAEDDIKFFKAFLRKLQDKGWLKE